MLISKNVNNDVSKVSPIDHIYPALIFTLKPPLKIMGNKRKIEVRKRHS